MTEALFGIRTERLDDIAPQRIIQRAEETLADAYKGVLQDAATTFMGCNEVERSNLTNTFATLLADVDREDISDCWAAVSDADGTSVVYVAFLMLVFQALAVPPDAGHLAVNDETEEGVIGIAPKYPWLMPKEMAGLTEQGVVDAFIEVFEDFDIDLDRNDVSHQILCSGG